MTHSKMRRPPLTKYKFRFRTACRSRAICMEITSNKAMRRIKKLIINNRKVKNKLKVVRINNSLWMQPLGLSGRVSTSL